MIDHAPRLRVTLVDPGRMLGAVPCTRIAGEGQAVAVQLLGCVPKQARGRAFVVPEVTQRGAVAVP